MNVTSDSGWCGMLFVPKALNQFWEKQYEALAVAVIRNGYSIPSDRLEAIQNACTGGAEIFRGREEKSVVLTFPVPYKKGLQPDNIVRLLRKNSINCLVCKASPEMLEDVANKELGSSLKIQ